MQICGKPVEKFCISIDFFTDFHADFDVRQKFMGTDFDCIPVFHPCCNQKTRKNQVDSIACRIDFRDFFQPFDPFGKSPVHARFMENHPWRIYFRAVKVFPADWDGLYFPVCGR